MKGIELLYFKDKDHKKAFLELVEEMYLDGKEIENLSMLLRRQLAFVYLIAAYQREYEKQEGEAFYIEIGEELSLGGPTYLLDERYGERMKDYEKILPIASKVLQGQVEFIQKNESILLNEDIEEDFMKRIALILKQALKIIKGENSVVA